MGFFKVNFHNYHPYFCFSEYGLPINSLLFFSPLNENMLFSFMSHAEISANPSGLEVTA